MLNKIEGVKTFSSCSGHETKEKLFEIHINIEYNESENLKKTLEFFEEQGFTVKLIVDEYPVGELGIGTKRYYSVITNIHSKDGLTQEKINGFWDYMKKKFLENLN